MCGNYKQIHRWLISMVMIQFINFVTSFFSFSSSSLLFSFLLLLFSTLGLTPSHVYRQIPLSSLIPQGSHFPLAQLFWAILRSLHIYIRFRSHLKTLSNFYNVVFKSGMITMYMLKVSKITSAQCLLGLL